MSGKTVVRRHGFARAASAVACLILCPLTFAAAASEPTLDDLPQPPEYELVAAEHLTREHLTAELRQPLPDGLTPAQIGDRGAQEAERWVGWMTEGGWRLLEENRQRRGGEFRFAKGVLLRTKLSVGTDAKPMEGRMKSFLFARFDLTRRVPFEDVKGLDPDDVPRYPGSVRVRWMHLMGDFAAKYLVAGSLDEVTEFFREEVPKLGWEPGRGAGTLNFTRGGVTSPDQVAAQDRTVSGDPLERIGRMIPDTLAIHLADDDGVVSIGIGSTAGSSASAPAAAALSAPPAAAAEDSAPVITRIDPDTDLPAYPGLVERSRRTLPPTLAGAEITRLTLEMTEAEQAEALRMAEFFLAEMAARDWALERHEWYGIGRKLSFRKSAVRVEVGINAVGRYPIPERAPRITIPVEIDVVLPLPAREPAGQDIPGVPRYPGSVRFHYLEAGIDHAVKFKAVASLDQAEWFFIETLPEHGWAFAGNDTTGLLFVPGGTAGSAVEALAQGALVPTTLKIKVDDHRDGTVKIGQALSKGDT